MTMINLGIGSGHLKLDISARYMNVNFGIPGGVPPESVPICPCTCSCNSDGSSPSDAPAAPVSESPRSAREKGEGPIRYSTGEIIFRSNDINSGGFGTPWGHTRSFANRLSDDDDLGQGYNWLVGQLPYIVCVDCNKFVLIGRTSQNLWFTENPDGTFTTRHGFKARLESGSLILTDIDGSQTVFSDLRSTPPGRFQSC